jgi:hypothetical protein
MVPVCTGISRRTSYIIKQELFRLLSSSSSEAEDSTEQCWNWKNGDYQLDDEKDER